VKYCFCIS